jgi:hypothetical protein
MSEIVELGLGSETYANFKRNEYLVILEDDENEIYLNGSELKAFFAECQKRGLLD